MQKEIVNIYLDYCKRNELGEGLPKGSVLDLMYSEVVSVDDNDLIWEVQVSYDVEKEIMITSLKNPNEELIYKVRQGLKDFMEELSTCNWGDYYSWAHEITEQLFSIDLEW